MRHEDWAGAAEIAGRNKVRSGVAAGLYMLYVVTLWIVIMSDKVLVSGGRCLNEDGQPVLGGWHRQL